MVDGFNFEITTVDEFALILDVVSAPIEVVDFDSVLNNESVFDGVKVLLHNFFDLLREGGLD